MSTTPGGARPLQPVISLVFFSTVFLSAFLLFQVQPLISRYILPWFGGSPAVWTTCMLFFQVTLFAGYVYAHLLVSRLRPGAQVVQHAAVLAAACLLLPIEPGENWKPDGASNPAVDIICLLSVTVGLPYFALSATGPLLQNWFLKAFPGRPPWRLYSLSNIGSLLALLTYPFVFEPRLTTQSQAQWWSLGFVAFAAAAVLSGLLMARLRRAPEGESLEPVPAEFIPPPSATDTLLWMALAAVPCVMLLATTSQVCADIAVVPFLWVLPLSIYLLSFILCFDSDRWYRRRLFAPALLLTAGLSCLLMWDSVMRWRLVTSIMAQATVFFGLLFFVCMVCHGELVRLKPHPRHLTFFYLSLSAGGALGGLFVGLIAPGLFRTLLELHLGIFAACALLLVVLFRDGHSRLGRGRQPQVWAVLLTLLAGLGVALQGHAGKVTELSVAVTRNFYGVLRVDARADSLVMLHGAIRHGHQFRDPDRRMTPTAYYSPQSGVGTVLRDRLTGEPRRVGVIGLGAGTLAAYARPGDEFRMYEINPAVERLARDYFTYLSECRGRCDVVIGDGRIALEREAPNQFDVLVLDAFSGDAVPAHLLTTECTDIYWKHLKPDGVLALHITNRHLDLRPVCLGMAQHHGMATRFLYHQRDRAPGAEPSLWCLMAREWPTLTRLDPGPADAIDGGPRVIQWTDSFSNLLAVMTPITHADPERVPEPVSAAGFRVTQSGVAGSD